MESAAIYNEERRAGVEDIEDFLALADSLQTISRDALEQSLEEDADISVMPESYRNIMLLCRRIFENGATTGTEYRLGVYKSETGYRYFVSITLGESDDGELSYRTRVRMRMPKRKRKAKK